MRSVTVQEAKTQLSALLRAVEGGEQVEIRRGSAPVALLVPRPPTRSAAALRGILAPAEAAAILDPSVWAPDAEDAEDFGTADRD